MKQFAALFLLVTLPLFGQANTDQIKIQTNGGLGADANKALIYKEYVGTSAPAGPLSDGMRWCDSNTTPCIPKLYYGSAWIVPVGVNSFPTQTDWSSFPGSPGDGQVFFSKSPHAICAYDATAVAWYCSLIPFPMSTASIVDIYTAAVISTVGAPTVAASGTAGSLSAGAYLYQVTCRNSTGGETTGGTTSASVSPGVNKSTDLSNIPTCGAGGTTRSIYRTNVNTSGPFYWVATIADNTTTTLNDGVADSALKGLCPDINFSAALPGAWTILNLQTNGGCGGTGARGSMVCYNGKNAVTTVNGQATDGATPRASLSVASYTSGNFTMQYRIKQLSQNGDSYQTVTSPSIFGMRNGTADNAQRFMLTLGGSQAVTLPLSSSVHGEIESSERITAGSSTGVTITLRSNPYPQLDALPLWIRWIRRSGSVMSYVSSNAVDWSPSIVCTGNSNNTNALCSISATAGASSMDHVELPFSINLANQAAGLGPWIEIDSFTLIVQ